MHRYISQGRVRQIFAMVMGMLFFAFATVDTWGQTKIILLPTDRYFPSSYWGGRNWSNQLGNDPAFASKVAFYKEMGLDIEWDEDLGHFVVRYSGDVFRRQGTPGNVPNPWRQVREKEAGFGAFPPCVKLSWWSTYTPYNGAVCSGGNNEVLLSMPLADAVKHYSNCHAGGEPVYAITDPAAWPRPVGRELRNGKPVTSHHDYNGIVIASALPRRLDNPSDWARYIARIPADLTRIPFPDVEDERPLPGISSGPIAVARVVGPSEELSAYNEAVRDAQDRLRRQPAPCQGQRSAPVLVQGSAAVPQRPVSVAQQTREVWRHNQGYAGRLAGVTAANLAASYLQSEIIANNPEMQINLDACAQVQYEARAEFWRPRGNDEGWWEYQWRTIYATLVMNAEAVGTSGF